MTAVNSDQVNDSSIDGEADIVERAIRYNTQRYLNLLSLSQNDLTGPLGITKGAVSQLLTGNSKLKFRQVYILARTFGVTVEELMDPTYMLESEELSRQLMKNRRKTKAEYLTGHYGPSDISHRELSAPAGARYLRKPDENEDRPHGAIGPRAFVMPLMDVDQMNLGPRFSARTRFKLPQVTLTPVSRNSYDTASESDRTNAFDAKYIAIYGPAIIEATEEMFNMRP